jgi:methionyl-tRNA formyltransferase
MNNLKKILLLGKGLNFLGWQRVVDLFQTLNVLYEIHHNIESVKKDYKIGILIGYERIVPLELLKIPRHGFFVFHSSDLPIGRGFAPIYNTIVRQLPLTQTLCYAVEQVDSGNIIAKAHYVLDGNELEQEVRHIDDELTMYLLKDALPFLLAGHVKGRLQQHESATWWPRRRPDDSMIDDSRPLNDFFDHLRALPPDAPAYFERCGRRYHVRLEVTEPARTFDPERLTVERYYDY